MVACKRKNEIKVDELKCLKLHLGAGVWQGNILHQYISIKTGTKRVNEICHRSENSYLTVCAVDRDQDALYQCPTWQWLMRSEGFHMLMKSVGD